MESLELILKLIVINHVRHFEAHVQLEAVTELSDKSYGARAGFQEFITVWPPGENKLCPKSVGNRRLISCQEQTPAVRRFQVRIIF